MTFLIWVEPFFIMMREGSLVWRTDSSVSHSLMLLYFVKRVDTWKVRNRVTNFKGRLTPKPTSNGIPGGLSEYVDRETRKTKPFQRNNMLSLRSIEHLERGELTGQQGRNPVMVELHQVNGREIQEAKVTRWLWIMSFIRQRTLMLAGSEVVRERLDGGNWQKLLIFLKNWQFRIDLFIKRKKQVNYNYNTAKYNTITMKLMKPK